MSVLSFMLTIAATSIWGLFSLPNNTPGNIGIGIFAVLLLILAEFCSLRGIPVKTLRNLLIACIQIGMLVCGFKMAFAVTLADGASAIIRMAFTEIFFMGSIYQGPYDVMHIHMEVHHHTKVPNHQGPEYEENWEPDEYDE